MLTKTIHNMWMLKRYNQIEYFVMTKSNFVIVVATQGWFLSFILLDSGVHETIQAWLHNNI